MNYSGNVLAFIGDAVLTLQVREYWVSKGYTKTKDLQEKSIEFVSAKAQASFMEYLLENEILNEEEVTIYKRGRNTKTHSIAKNADVITYRVATGFEALWGYIHLNKDQKRMDYLWGLFKDLVGEA